MGDILAASRTFLVAQAGITALIGTRVYPSLLPQNVTLPAMVMQMISDPHELLHDGPQGLPTARVQYDCWGRTSLEATNVAQALRAAVDGYVGAMGAVTVTCAAIENMIDAYEPTTQRYRVIVDVSYQRVE